MNIPAKRWADAARERHSSRTYDNKVLPEVEYKTLNEFTEKLNGEQEGVRAVLLKDGGDKVVQTILGSYGLIKGVRSYLAFIADTEDKYYHEKIGYLGEMCVLEATALGIDTCWISGTFKPEVVEKQLSITGNEKVIAVTPVGHSKEKSFVEKIMKKFTGSHKRKELEELCPDGFKQEWSEWIRESLELARIAPSAVNKQPWRFNVEENEGRIIVRVDSTTNIRRKRLDCGIVMVHIEIGALSNGIKGEWEYLSEPAVAAYNIIES